ncbi:MAG TPA: hypothetical protein VJH88_00995 [Candidatus Nanoarchaeia archaeon]|nr:hypothetical protein [Candidatus Nanoarchaeia archaeon]
MIRTYVLRAVQKCNAKMNEYSSGGTWKKNAFALWVTFEKEVDAAVRMELVELQRALSKRDVQAAQEIIVDLMNIGNLGWSEFTAVKVTYTGAFSKLMRDVAERKLTGESAAEKAKSIGREFMSNIIDEFSNVQLNMMEKVKQKKAA